MMKGYVWVLLLAMTGMECVAGFDEGVTSYEAQDYQSALRVFLPLANGGNAHAQFALGVMYANGEGVEQDYGKAEFWYRKAAEQGFAPAQNNLGLMYDEGSPPQVRPDSSEAEFWYRKAAEQGFAEAQFHLGALYYEGKGVPKDYSQAGDWYSKAAEQGYAEAQFYLGVMYHGGVSLGQVPEDYRYRQDYSKAEALIRKAAEQGYAEAQFYLGRLYYEGHVFPEDYSKAEFWYRKAAEQGYAKALSELGWSYGSDTGLSAKNLVLAHVFYNLAAVISIGEHEKIFRDQIAQQLTTVQLSEAQELASKWVKGHPLPTITSTWPSSKKKK
jgi:hypothetical protein